jgi:uncharacterized protein
MNLPELGVGFTWFPDLEPVLQANEDLVNVIEIEPQTLWRREPGAHSPTLNQTALDSLRRLPFAKLIHSVSCPLAGTLSPDSEQLELLRSIALQLEVPWLSEHLSFNRVADPDGVWHAGFLLPPRQTIAGVAAAVASIRAVSDCVPLPLSVETGVSYLRIRPDELPDGEFVARIAQAADCGILLDLHNVWTNDRNGRQPLGDYLAQLPLERICELHLAGGRYHRGFWLDTHSGPVPEDVLELAARIVPRLPNLKAIIFELFPAHFPRMGAGAFRSQLESLHRLWDRRAHAVSPQPPVPSDPPDRDPAPSPKEWENTLAALVVHKPCETPLAHELRRDPGLAVIREMVEKLRGSMIVRTLRLSSRLIMLERGPAFLEQLLATFWASHPPQASAVDEAEAFAAFLRAEKPYVPFLAEVLEYDRAVIAVALDGEERSIAFGADPLPLLRALGAGRRPTEITTGDFEIRLTPDLVNTEVGRLAGLEVSH